MTHSGQIPIRDGSRDGSDGCPMCGGPLPSTRARYCDDACKQRAFRLRHRATTNLDLAKVRHELRRRQALVAHTIYECSSCGERSLGERRCSECGLFRLAVGVGGLCPECDTPILLADLLGEEVVSTA